MSRRAAAGTSVPSSAHRYVCAFRMLASAKRHESRVNLLVWLAVMTVTHVGIMTAGRCSSSLLQADHAHDVCIAVSELTSILLRLLGGASPGYCGDVVVSSR